MTEIFYYHPLNLTFKSAQTLQVIKDYLYLSKKGYKVFLYGTYSQKEDLNEILNFIKDENIIIYYSKNKKLEKLINKFKFLFEIKKKKKEKIFITRHLNKTKEILFLKAIFKKYKILHEMHEESFPYLFKKKYNKNSMLKIIKKVDGIIFTNYSQELFFKKEFNILPKNFVVLPNGVEIEKFENTSFSNNYVLTYVGQFNHWKNVELIFSSFSLLDKRFTLRVAGGKNDIESEKFINNLIKKYNIEKERVHFFGFVKNDEIVEKVLNKSNILLLPLGDNIQSKYLTSPMKLFEYMATKIPVLAVDYPSINLIAESNMIYLSKCDAKDFSKKIKEVILDKNLNKKIKNMNIKVKDFSYENRSFKYDKFLKGLI